MKLDTPWNRARKTRSQLQEDRLTKTPGGKKGVNSGRFWRFKRDGKIFTFLIEARDTTNKSYRVEKDEFLAVKKNALQTPPGCAPALQVDIQDLRLVVLEQRDFIHLQEYIVELEERLGLGAMADVS